MTSSDSLSDAATVLLFQEYEAHSCCDHYELASERLDQPDIGRAVYVMLSLYTVTSLSTLNRYVSEDVADAGRAYAERRGWVEIRGDRIYRTDYGDQLREQFRICGRSIASSGVSR
ncbi:hypothetical protein GOPIP_044_00850 [Gordonia polyisoprenivorans NBRC 16320 = JCM 10675]|uniref:Uncharacterized protein n=1 Tax=Gordonia polyisoprenivorans TaxID=84595 RepID=A0A846WRZ7_9ACTN|nr:hypothetical protein [Gordonia polyisoprenivorans]NKY04374.1 hypothetical protein [Gordonia polyisoprenivorans]GAB23393.1 hypothetical protein GOPIP_044_00850 [Gordonia polyisoprenivorans NBRC 16320 = JCM 10675]